MLSPTLPSVAIVDPVLARTQPRRLACDSGMDALTHAIEAYVSVYSNDFTDAMALHAIKIIWDNLSESVNGEAGLEKTAAQELTFSDADKKLLETEKQWFADAEKTAQDIEECDNWCKQLAGTSAKLHAQMLPEELERLQALSQQFACGAPAEEELQACFLLT